MHRIDALYGSEGADLLVTALTVTHPDTLYRQKAGNGLKHRIIEASVTDLFDKDCIDLSESLQSFIGHRSDTSHPKSWTWERVAPQQFIR